MSRAYVLKLLGTFLGPQSGGMYALILNISKFNVMESNGFKNQNNY